MASVAFCSPTFVRLAWFTVQEEAQDVPQVDQLIQYFNESCLNGQFAIQMTILKL